MKKLICKCKIKGLKFCLLSIGDDYLKHKLAAQCFCSSQDNHIPGIMFFAIKSSCSSFRKYSLETKSRVHFIYYTFYQ